MNKLHDQVELENAIKKLAFKHDKPYVYVSNLVHIEMNQGMAVPDALEAIDKFLPQVGIKVS